MVKNPPAMQETQVGSLGREDSLKKEMATHFSTLAGEFHRQRSLAGYSAWDCKRVGHELVTKNNNDHMANLQKKVQTGAE